MKIKFLSPDSLDKNLKATVHKSGKMGFTIEAAKKMGLDINKSLSIGINEDDTEDKNLYVVINSNKRSDSFSLLKTGEYLIKA
jgi:ribosomal protein L13E